MEFNSRNLTIFVAFLLIFSSLVIIAGFSDVSDHDLAPSISLELPAIFGSKIEVEEVKYADYSGYNSIESLHVKNKGLMKSKGILKIELDVHRNKSKLNVFLNGNRTFEYNLRGDQTLYTDYVEFKTGRNHLELKYSFDALKVEKVEVIESSKVDEKRFLLSENWEREGKEVKGLYNSTIYIYSKEKAQKALFKFLINTHNSQSLNLSFNGNSMDSIEPHNNFKIYRTPWANLRKGKNTLRFESHDKFNLRSFEVKYEGLKESFYLAKNWYPTENSYHRIKKPSLDFNWMSQNGTLRFFNTKDNTIQKDVTLEVSSFHSPRNFMVYNKGKKIGSFNLSFNVSQGREEVLLRDISLEPGMNSLKIYSLQGCQVPEEVKGNNDDRCLSLSLYSISDPVRTVPLIEQMNRWMIENGVYWVLMGSLAVVMIFSILRGLKSDFKLNDKRMILLLMAALFIFSFGIRSAKPKTFQLYVDEPWALEASNSITKGQGPLLCSYEASERVCNLYPKTVGYPVYLSFILFVTGFSLSAVFWNSVFLGSFSVLLVFILSYEVTKKLKASFISSLIYAVFPAHIFWSTTAESYVTSFFFVLLSFTLIYRYLEEPRTYKYAAAWSSLIFTFFLRPENILILPIFLYLLYKNREVLKFEIGEQIVNFLSVLGIGIYSINLISSLDYYMKATSLIRYTSIFSSSIKRLS